MLQRTETTEGRVQLEGDFRKGQRNAECDPTRALHCSRHTPTWILLERGVRLLETVVGVRVPELVNCTEVMEENAGLSGSACSVSGVKGVMPTTGFGVRAQCVPRVTDAQVKWVRSQGWGDLRA